MEFYGCSAEPYGILCNFYPSPVHVDGVRYPTVEHYYQCQKFVDVEYRSLIRSASTANKARMLAQQRIAAAAGGYKWRVALSVTIRTHLSRGVSVRPDWGAGEGGSDVEGAAGQVHAASVTGDETEGDG